MVFTLLRDDLLIRLRSLVGGELRGGVKILGMIVSFTLCRMA
jgi:hypothetical protein